LHPGRDIPIYAFQTNPRGEFMAQPFEDFLVELAEKGDQGVLSRIDDYLHSHLVREGNIAAERERLAVAFKAKAPYTELSEEIFNRIIR